MSKVKAAATAELTPAHANNKADNVAQHAKIESPQMGTLSSRIANTRGPAKIQTPWMSIQNVLAT